MVRQIQSKMVQMVLAILKVNARIVALVVLFKLNVQMKLQKKKQPKPIKNAAVFEKQVVSSMCLIKVCFVGLKKAIKAPSVADTLVEFIKNEVLELDELCSFVQKKRVNLGFGLFYVTEPDKSLLFSWETEVQRVFKFYKGFIKTKCQALFNKRTIRC